MTRSTMRVERELYLAAPEGIAVYAQNPSYVSVRGETLVESVKHEAMHFDAQGRRHFYHPRIFRRYSVDHGRTWTATPDQAVTAPEALDGRHRNVSLHTLDVSRDVLISLYSTYDVDMAEDMFAGGNRRQRTYLLWYELSFDGGQHWTPARQVIDARPGYTAMAWGPGLRYGCTSAMTDLCAPVWLADGTVLFGLTVLHAPRPGDALDDPHRPGSYGVQYLRGRWNADGTDLLWELGDQITLTPEQSPLGCCEPAPLPLGGDRLFNVMRCQGDEARGIPSTRYATLSTDGGRTWSAPEPLRYDDGEIVCTPASLSAFVRSSRTGACYWLANILPGPVYDQMPRYPLTLAVFDPERCRIRRDAVYVIQDRPPHLPVQVRYTNWGCYEERGTGDLILTLPEQPKHMDFTAMTRPEDFTADCYRYRVRLPD